MPLCVPKRNLGFDILQCTFAVENSGTEDGITLSHLPIKQAFNCDSPRATIYRSPHRALRVRPDSFRLLDLLALSS